ncbi:MAG TPA: hypothetical protein DIW30_03290 [Bacteroidales bacterium]|nr:hypothetical protein [Bacteroidales bacterium]
MKRLFSLLSGVAMGALLGVIFAPQSGKETREQIKKLLQEKMPDLSKERLEELVDEVVAKVRNVQTETSEGQDNDHEA